MTDAEKIKALQQDADLLARALQYAMAAIRSDRPGVVNGTYLRDVLKNHAETVRAC